MMWLQPSLWETAEVADFLREQRQHQASSNYDGDVRIPAPSDFDEEALALLNEADIGFPRQQTQSNVFPDVRQNSHWITV
eukprot:3368067-Karenia_brevis.AAC.1